MFIDILIVSILTNFWLETLMRPICQLQRFSDLIAYFKLEIPDKYCRHRSCAIINQRQRHSFFDHNRQHVCGLLKNYSFFWENFAVFAVNPKKWSLMIGFIELHNFTE